MARRSEITLSRDVILTAAFALLNEQGLEGLTMRAVAEQLSVQPPALYWHFKDKAELLSWMAAAMLRDARADVEDCPGWRDWLGAFGRRFVRILLACRDGARLWASAQPIVVEDPAEQSRIIIEPLTARGLGDEAAHWANASIMAFSLGWATYLSNEPMADLLGKLMDLEDAFDKGLTALIAGMAVDDDRVR